MTGQAGEKLYGEPVELRSNFIYFTSWKYVRPGTLAWKVDLPPDADQARRDAVFWHKGDGGQLARFETYDMPRGVRLVAQKAAKKPLPIPDVVLTVIHEDGLYRAWYAINPCGRDEPFSTNDRILPGTNQHLCYAESSDGLNWRTPPVGLFEYAGGMDNSIVFRGDVNGSARGFHGGCVFRDPSQGAGPDEQYKMIYLGAITDQEWEAFERKHPGQADSMARRNDVGGFRCVVGVFGAVSPDGIHWRQLDEPLMIQHADTMNTCYYDLELRKYVAYVRAWQASPAAGAAVQDRDSWIGVAQRSIGRAYSDDFRHFTKPEIVVAPGADMPPCHVWYANAKTTLPGCPDQHVMFPWLWKTDSETSEVHLFSSPTGEVWTKVPGGPVLEEGPPGQPDGGFTSCAVNLLEYPGDLWGIPYYARPYPHSYPGQDVKSRKGLFPGLEPVSGLATWPKGRLVAMECDQEGQFSTVHVVPRGNRIRLNATVRPSGCVKVALRALGKGDVEGRSFDDTDPLVGDGLAMPVTWGGQADLNCGGAPVMLRFHLRFARLFGIEFF